MNTKDLFKEDNASAPPDPPPPNGMSAGHGAPPPAPSVSITTEMQTAYLDYAMSVIVSRAIPDLRDGLKPVHRRILYAMFESNNSHDKPYRKSARPVGDVMGKYHPHGDAAIYDALVRMAQDFSMSLKLLDGQGNFGSMDGDNPAAMRYTEVRMHQAAQSLLADIERDTVDFRPNYDGKDQEPCVLPARFPNLLVNGSAGIAVGMATNIPPHNLGEVIDATLALIDNPDLSSQDLMDYIPAPDFPTGGVIMGQSGARRAYNEARGSVIVRAKVHIETPRKDREIIVVDEMPYQVNKALMIEKIAALAREKKIDGIATIRDESDRTGVRVVIELKRDAEAAVVLNQLYRFSSMQVSFGCNMLALNGGRPEHLTLRGFLQAFIEFRQTVVTRQIRFDLNKARTRSHILCGLAVAVANVDAVVRKIRAAATPAEARDALMQTPWPAADIAEYIRLVDDPNSVINADNTYHLTETQARAILDLRLQRLTALGVQEITDELEKLAVQIRDYLSILGSEQRVLDIIKDQLAHVKQVFAVPRRTEISDQDPEQEDEDLIKQEDMVVTVTSGGYIKRTPLVDFRAQKRGGKGVSGMNTKEDDIVTQSFVANTHSSLLFFTTHGLVYRLKTWQLPEAKRSARGKAIVNLLPIERNVSIAAILPIALPIEEWHSEHIIFATNTGHVRRNSLADFTNIFANGKIAMKLLSGVSLINVRLCTEHDDILLITRDGQSIRFGVGDVRVFKGRGPIGIRGIKLRGTDRVVSMTTLTHFEATPNERTAYLKLRRAAMRAHSNTNDIDSETNETETNEIETTTEDSDAFVLSPERYSAMQAAEQLLLTISARGLGKLSVSHDYRIQTRGGIGTTATDKAQRGGDLVACLPVQISDQILVATSAGQSIRCNISEISLQSRTGGGVRILDTADDETTVSVSLIAETETETEPETEPAIEQ